MLIQGKIAQILLLLLIGIKDRKVYKQKTYFQLKKRVYDEETGLFHCFDILICY